MNIQFMNKWTGEIHELPADTPEQISEAWQALSETIKACERAKDKLKPRVEAIVNDKGLCQVGDHQFRVMNIQRYNYDKATMRQVLDEDMLDLLLVPDKPRVDTYIKEHLSELGEDSSILRENMIPVGNPYQTIKLEKLK